MAIAETLNLPIVGVLARHHMFVRWDPDGEHDAMDPLNPVNEHDFNWETTKGKPKTDDYYRSKDNIADDSIIQGVYLNNLNRDDMLAIQYVNRGFAFMDKRDNNRAIGEFNKAIKLNSQYSAAYHNKGVALARIDNIEEAMEEIDKAIDLDPNSARSYTSMGMILHHNGKYKEAIKEFNEAIRSDPEYPVAHLVRGKAWEKMGEQDKADEDFKTAKSLEKKAKLKRHDFIPY